MTHLCTGTAVRRTRETLSLSTRAVSSGSSTAHGPGGTRRISDSATWSGTVGAPPVPFDPCSPTAFIEPLLEKDLLDGGTRRFIQAGRPEGEDVNERVSFSQRHRIEDFTGSGSKKHVAQFGLLAP